LTSFHASLRDAHRTITTLALKRRANQTTLRRDPPSRIEALSSSLCRSAPVKLPNKTITSPVETPAIVHTLHLLKQQRLGHF
jgi:hypothetical protein